MVEWGRKACAAELRGEGFMRRGLSVFLCLLLLTLALPVPALAAVRTAAPGGQTASSSMSALERSIVEQGLRLLPYDHPFVLAYEETYQVHIDSYMATIKGVKVSGVPFEFGGSGNFLGYASRWWKTTDVADYPVGGLDCAEYIAWIYKQLGYDVPDSSTALFFAGKAGVARKLPGIREHLVIPSFENALIGDVAYNSQNYSYQSGHGSHTEMFLGTANKLGIGAALQKYYPGFPLDAFLVLDCGWSDGNYYYNLMRKLHVSNPRRSMAGVGVQFFTSVRSGGKYLYRCPSKVYKWTNPETGHTFRIESRLEAQRRPLQYKPQSAVQYPMNLSRPIVRTDG